MPKTDNFKGKGGTKGFHVNPENINKNGRPPKIYTVIKEMGYSKADVRIAFGELAWYSIKKLESVSKDAKMPAITRIVARQFVDAHTDGNWNKIKDILEHTIGKPRQTIDGNLGINTVVQSSDGDVFGL